MQGWQHAVFILVEASRSLNFLLCLKNDLLACGLASLTWGSWLLLGCHCLCSGTATCSSCSGSYLQKQACPQQLRRCSACRSRCIQHELPTKPRLCLDSPGCALQHELPTAKDVLTHHASWLSHAATAPAISVARLCVPSDGCALWRAAQAVPRARLFPVPGAQSQYQPALGHSGPQSVGESLHRPAPLKDAKQYTALVRR